MPINNYLRTKNLFDNYGLTLNQPFDNVQFGGPEPRSYIEPPPEEVPVIPASRPDVSTRVKDMYTPETVNNERFDALLDAAPEMEEPSVLRKIAAAGAYLGNTRRNIPGGFEAAEKVRNAPYDREMADWKDKTGPYYNAANLERQNNINERQLTTQTVLAEINQQKADEAERKNRESADIARIRAEAYDFKMRHPDWKIDFDGPNIIAVSPDGQQSVNLGPSGHLSDVDKLNLQQTNEMSRIAARGDEARETKQTVPGGSTASFEQNEKRRTAILQEVYNQRPDLREFIKFPETANGTWQMGDPPTASWGGYGSLDPTKMDKYNELRGALGYSPLPGGTNTQQPNTAQPPRTPSIGPAQPNTALPVPGRGASATPNPTPVPTQITQVEPGYVKIHILGMDPSDPNSIVQVPADNLQRALATGLYEQVP